MEDYNKYERKTQVEVGEYGEQKRWSPEKPGETFRGRYLRSEDGTGAGEGYKFHIFMDGQGCEVSVFGRSKINQLLGQAKVGGVYEIEYLGDRSTKPGRTFYDYKLYELEEPAGSGSETPFNTVDEDLLY